MSALDPSVAGQLAEDLPPDVFRTIIATFEEDLTRLVASLDKLSKDGVDNLDPIIQLIQNSNVVLGTQAEQSDDILAWSKNLNLVTALILAFGLCFQLPVVMTLLGLANLISSKVMAKGRRYAIVAVVVVAAVVTPPDPISQLMLAVPMVLLYEISIWCVRIIELRRKKTDETEAAA